MPAKFLDVQALITEKIHEAGGWVNCHAHIDRAFTITQNTLIQKSLAEKPKLVDEVKRNSTVTDFYDRMVRVVELMIGQGVTILCSFIDVDEVVEEKAIEAAVKVRERYRNDICILYANQTIKGILDPQGQAWFERGAAATDIIGVLPVKDRGREAEHFDVVMETAKRLAKMVHVHVDQFNTPQEKETELLVAKTVEHGLQGKVVAIHGTSTAAQPKAYREKLYQSMRDAGIMLITCPNASISSPRTEELSPTHNSIAAIDELVPAHVTVALGTDNIHDIYLPMNDGNIWSELKMLMMACRFTNNIEELVNIATTNGKKALGLKS